VPRFEITSDYSIPACAKLLNESHSRLETECYSSGDVSDTKTVNLKKLLVICVVIGRLGSLAAAQVPIYLGVLEPPQPRARGPWQQFHIRIAFRFQDGHWAAMPHNPEDEEALAKVASMYPAQVSWTVALNGRKVGSVRSFRALICSRYMDVGIEKLIAGSNPPKVTTAAESFETWMGDSPFRPLVVVSEPNYKDTEWSALNELPEALQKQARGAFRKGIALNPNCNGKPTHNYPDKYIQPLGPAYRSASGDILLALRADPAQSSCGETYGEWQSAWFC